jgi:predicted TIM-barrel fold metal-dependent hydrolase
VLRHLCAIVLLLALGAAAQSRPQIPFPPDPTRPDETHPVDPTEAKMERERVKKMNEHRQDQIKHDTDELLKLATELKEQVDKTNEHMLSLDVVRKAEQIEKLAKSVKEKMKASYP